MKNIVIRILRVLAALFSIVELALLGLVTISIDFLIWIITGKKILSPLIINLITRTLDFAFDE